MNISLEINNRRLWRPGHVVRMYSDKKPKVAMRWTPTGRRKRSRQKEPPGAVMKQLEEMGLLTGQSLVQTLQTFRILNFELKKSTEATKYSE